MELDFWHSSSVEQEKNEASWNSFDGSFLSVSFASKEWRENF